LQLAHLSISTDMNMEAAGELTFTAASLAEGAASRAHPVSCLPATHCGCKQLALLGAELLIQQVSAGRSGRCSGLDTRALKILVGRRSLAAASWCARMPSQCLAMEPTERTGLSPSAVVFGYGAFTSRVRVRLHHRCGIRACQIEPRNHRYSCTLALAGHSSTTIGGAPARACV
jgi:hypothetical protein